MAAKSYYGQFYSYSATPAERRLARSVNPTFGLKEVLKIHYNKRIIEKRWAELVAEVRESREAFERGEVKRGTVKDLIKDLEN